MKITDLPDEIIAKIADCLRDREGETDEDA